MKTEGAKKREREIGRKSRTTERKRRWGKKHERGKR